MPTNQEALRERLRRLFLDELDDQVDRLHQGIDRLAGTLPETSPDTVAELFRAAHSLKGAAQAVGDSTVGQLCHHLEEALAAIRDGSLHPDDELLQRFAAATDAIAEAGRRTRQGDELPLRDAAPHIAALTDHMPATPPGPEPAATPVANPTVAPPARPHPVVPLGGAQPAAAGPPGDASAVRLPAERFDSLLAQAGDLVAASYRGERLVADLAAVAAGLAADEERWRCERLLLDRPTAEAAPAHAQTASALGRVNARLGEVSVEVERLARSTANYQRQLRGLADGFAAAVRHARTVPFTDATAGLARIVRDLCRDSNKQARLVVDASDVEIDKSLAATLNDVLRHLVRNAVDHGLEPVADRTGAGKPATGLVQITAVLRSDGIEIVVTDDGRGVDAHAVRAAARRIDAFDPGEDTMPVSEVVFQPGLTTSDRVTTVSGRGVGLDAVRTRIEASGGSVDLTSQSGTGTRVVVTVPMTQSILRTVLVRAAGEVVALPSAAVQNLLRIPPLRAVVDGRAAVSLHGELVPVVRLVDVLGWANRQTTPAHGLDLPAVLVSGTQGLVLLEVDELVAEREIVLAPAPARLSDTPALLGTTQLDDGAVALVLNPLTCTRLGLASAHHRRASGPDQEQATRTVLLVEDTLTTRELERSILEAAGYTVLVSPDGAHAFETLQEHPVDAVVSDINMPRMDGVALCQAIRGADQLGTLPVILVTSLDSEQDRRRGLHAGADAYLTKGGFDRAELLEALERVL